MCNLDSSGSDTHCIDGKCVGMSKGQECSSSDQCDVGLYCNTTCVEQKGLDSTCSTD